jgi:hypothetical protein
MRKFLIATVVTLSTLAFSQPVKADPNLAYKLAYKQISTSNSNSFKNEKFREYVLKWLEQDKGHPYDVAISYCQDKSSGLSYNQIVSKTVMQLREREAIEDWSGSRFNAYVLIHGVGISVARHHYCPELIND